MGKQALKKQLGNGSKQRRIIPTKSTEQSSWSRRDISTTFLVDRGKQHFSVPIFCGSVWKSWRESPNCWRCPVPARRKKLSYYLTWSKLHRIWIWKGSELFVDSKQYFLAWKLKFVKGRCYDTYDSKEKKKKPKDEFVGFTETGNDDEEQEEVALLTYVNFIMRSIFSNVEVYINNQQIYNSNGLYAHQPYISNNFKAAISDYKGVLHCEGSDNEQDPEDISNPYLIPCLQGEWNCYVDLTVSCCMTIWWLTFSHLLNCSIQTWKIRLRLNRARPNFYVISDNPNVSLGIVDWSLALKDDYHKKRMDMLAYAPVEYNYLETLTKTFIIPARQNQIIQENIFNNSPIRRVAIAMNKNSAFTGSFTENPFWYLQFDLKQIRILKGGQPLVDFDTVAFVVSIWLPWKQWFFSMIFPQSPLMISKITMCWCPTWLQCKTLPKNVTIFNLLENHWDWS